MNTRELLASVLGVLAVGAFLWWSGQRETATTVAAFSGFFVAKLARLWWRKRRGAPAETAE